jgi:hypothetical protein
VLLIGYCELLLCGQAIVLFGLLLAERGLGQIV